MEDVTSFFFHGMTWVVQLLFFGSLWPQIMLNNKQKSTKGLSDLMLLGYLNGYATNVYYVFCMGLPFAYKIMLPVSAATMLVLWWQRFYFHAQEENRNLLLFFGGNFLVLLLLLPFAYQYPRLIGLSCGWIMFCIWGTFELPQIAKNYSRQSTQGLSFLLVSMAGLGNFLDIICACKLGFPVITVCNGTWAMVIFLIFCMQFWRYS